MILSRTLAKQRINQAERPSWIAAWLPVAFDAACLIFLFTLFYRPFQSLVVAYDVPVWGIALTLLVIAFIPVQVVLILSSLWAAKSRFKPDETGT